MDTVHKDFGLLLESGDRALAEQNDAQSALAYFLKAELLSPNDAAVHHKLGIAYWQLNHADKATEHSTQAVRLCPSNLSFVLTCGEILVANDKFGQAESLYSRYLKLNPTSVFVLSKHWLNFTKFKNKTTKIGSHYSMLRNIVLVFKRSMRNINGLRLNHSLIL